MTTSDNNNPAYRRDWVTRYLATLLGINERKIDLTKSLDEYGLDSVDAMIMVGDLEKHFGIEFDPAVCFEYDNLQQMLDAWNAADGSQG